MVGAFIAKGRDVRIRTEFRHRRGGGLERNFIAANPMIEFSCTSCGKRYKLEDINEGYRDMHDGKVIRALIEYDH